MSGYSLQDFITRNSEKSAEQYNFELESDRLLEVNLTKAEASFIVDLGDA